jgi:hypothetical protein
LWNALGWDDARDVRDQVGARARSGGGPRSLGAYDALAGEETVDDTMPASASIDVGSSLLGGQGGAMSSVEQSLEVAVLGASANPGDRLLGAVVFEHLVDRVQLFVVV